MRVPQLPKIYAYHRLVSHAKKHDININRFTWIVTEKLDGSQFRILLTPEGYDCGSKNIWGKDNIAKSFSLAKERTAELWERWNNSGLPSLMLYTEFMSSPKHNVLKYDRVPLNNLYLFAAYDLENNEWYDMYDLKDVALVLQIEPPVLLGAVSNLSEELFTKIINMGSRFGGKMEGVVLVTYDITHGDFWLDGRGEMFPLRTKYVSPEFREVHRAVWGRKPKEQKVKTVDDIVDELLESFVTEQRLKKIKQQMIELGIYTGTNKDIGNAIRMYVKDLYDEEYDAIVAYILDIVLKRFQKRLGRKVSKMILQSEW